MASKKKRKRESGQDIIVNMGLFWDRDKVCWEWKRPKKSLAGIRLKPKKGKGPVDFWNQQGIYALYDSNFNLVYVGLADKQKLGGRLQLHNSNHLSGRWKLFSWFGLIRVTDKNELDQSWELKNNISRKNLLEVLEGIIIDVAEPPMNGQDGRFGRNVEKYQQATMNGTDPQRKEEDDLDMLWKNAEKKLNNIENLLKGCKKKSVS